MAMKIGDFDLNNKVLIVAEIGNNHEGDFNVAKELIVEAASAKVDAIKFQTFKPEYYVSSSDAERLERLKKFNLSNSQFIELSELAGSLGLIFFSTPFDIESAKFLNSIQPVFKISSGDNNFFKLIETVANFGKPTMISMGMADMPLIESIVNFWNKKSTLNRLSILHCVSSYPVPEGQENLGAIHALRKAFPSITIGYSDHTLGIEAGKIAVASGARIIEKHFTLNKAHSDFRDHQLSADPNEMSEMVRSIRKVESIIGRCEKSVQPCELPMLSNGRRSIAALQDLEVGHLMTEEDLTWVRPGSGIPIGREFDIIGRRTKRRIKLGELIMEKDLHEK